VSSIWQSSINWQICMYILWLQSYDLHLTFNKQPFSEHYHQADIVMLALSDWGCSLPGRLSIVTLSQWLLYVPNWDLTLKWTWKPQVIQSDTQFSNVESQVFTSNIPCHCQPGLDTALRAPAYQVGMLTTTTSRTANPLLHLTRHAGQILTSLFLKLYSKSLILDC